MKNWRSTLLVFITIFNSSSLLKSQTNTWTWMNGTNLPFQTCLYGIMGVASPGNIPGSREYAGTWTDNNYNLWVFGGSGYATSTGWGHLDDLWKYDVITNQWTWMRGSNNTGSKGIYTDPDPFLNNPGARAQMVTWKDNNGNFWLFGGIGCDSSYSSGYLNDLWKYNMTTNTWVWINGSRQKNQNGTYGTQGVGAQSNTPGGRCSAAAWADNNGNLWLFGGQGYGANGLYYYLNDLWKYNIALNEWTWVSGSNGGSQLGIYGSQGVPAATNRPGSRLKATAFSADNTNFWMFGGSGYASTSTAGGLNDLWKFDITTNQWTWMKGANVVNQNGVYGTQGVFASSNTPGARREASGWRSGNELWLFGGTTIADNWNDLWKYDMATNQWTWINGSNTINQPGAYGTIGVPAASNSVSARGGAANWIDNCGNLWLYGGYSPNGPEWNDLWRFQLTNPLVPPPSPTINAMGSNLTICSNNQATISATTSTGTVGWYTTATSGTCMANGNSYVTSALSTGTAVSTYTYYAEAILGCVPGNMRAMVVLTVNPLPVLGITSSSPVLCAGETATLIAVGANTYTWSTSATGPAIAVSPTTNTTYSLIGIDANGCGNTSVYTQTVSACIGLKESTVDQSFAILFPNPFADIITVISEGEKKDLKIYNILGELVYSLKLTSKTTEIDLGDKPKGMYFINIESAKRNEMIKIIKE